MLCKAVAKYPDSFELLYDRAMAAERIDRLDVMEADLKRVIEMKPDYAHAYNALGYTLAEKTNRLRPKPSSSSTRRTSSSPTTRSSIDSLGWVEYRMGHVQEALKQLQVAYSSRPDPEIAAHLGEVLWKSGQREEAQKIWRAALAENPNHESLLAVIQKYHPERRTRGAGAMIARLAAAALAVLLAACAALAPPETPLPQLAAVPAVLRDERAPRGARGPAQRDRAASLDRARGASDEWVVSSPLGNEVARIESTPHGATLTRAGDSDRAGRDFPGAHASASSAWRSTLRGSPRACTAARRSTVAPGLALHAGRDATRRRRAARQAHHA